MRKILIILAFATFLFSSCRQEPHYEGSLIVVKVGEWSKWQDRTLYMQLTAEGEESDIYEKLAQNVVYSFGKKEGDGYVLRFRLTGSPKYELSDGKIEEYRPTLDTEEVSLTVKSSPVIMAVRVEAFEIKIDLEDN